MCTSLLHLVGVALLSNDVALLVDHALTEELVEDLLVLLHLRVNDRVMVGVGLELLVGAEELLPVGVEFVLLMLHLLDLGSAPLLLRRALEQVCRLAL